MNNNWQMMKLIDVIQKTETINPQKNPDSSFEYIDVSSICNKQFVIQETSTILGKDAPSRARKLVRTGDILFATVRPTLKRIAQVPNNLDKQVCSTGYFVLRPKDFVEGRFLFYFLFTENFMGEMEKLQKGASYPAVNDGEVSRQTIYLPPLSEQKRIVAILDEAFEGCDRAIRNTEKNLANARELFESYLNDIFTQKGKGWVERKLEEISECVSVGHVGETSSFYCDENDGIPFVRSQNVRPRRLELDGVRYITKKFHAKLKKSRLISGDLLFVRVGVNRGDCCSVPANLGELNCANIVFARPREGLIDYLEYYCQSKTGRSQLMGMTTGSAQGVINTKSVAELLIPFPHIDEQREISGKIDSLATEIQRLETIYRQKLAALKELKQSILQKAFTGELTADKEVA